jgi:hypothetical protein
MQAMNEGSENRLTGQHSQGDWTIEDTQYALAMHITLDWNELNLLARCACEFPNVPEHRCIICKRAHFGNQSLETD